MYLLFQYEDVIAKLYNLSLP